MPVYRFTRKCGDGRDGLTGDLVSVFRARNDEQAAQKAKALDRLLHELGGFTISQKLERGCMVAVRIKRFRKTKDVPT